MSLEGPEPNRILSQTWSVARSVARTWAMEAGRSAGAA
jgi:hypothetical protein